MFLCEYLKYYKSIFTKTNSKTDPNPVYLKNLGYKIYLVLLLVAMGWKLSINIMHTCISLKDFTLSFTIQVSLWYKNRIQYMHSQKYCHPRKASNQDIDKCGLITSMMILDLIQHMKLEAVRFTIVSPSIVQIQIPQSGVYK